MALPELTMPDGTPGFYADGHTIELMPIYADVAMRTGHDRRRRVYTTVPRVMSVVQRLSKAQMLAFHQWFEGPLQAGVAWFSAQVANQGPGLLWWKARYAEPYTAEALAGGWHKVTSKLLLVGDGSVTGPYSPNLQASTQIALSGSAVVTSAIYLAADTVVALLPAVFLSASTVVALSSIVDGAPASAVDFEKRWIWMRFPYERGRTADVTDTQEFDQRSWMGI